MSLTPETQQAVAQLLVLAGAITVPLLIAVCLLEELTTGWRPWERRRRG